MRTFLLLSSLFFGSIIANAQTIVSTFDSLTLPKSDTFYTNFNNPLTDVGFNDGFAHFPSYFDTSWGGMWSGGFVYSNVSDSITTGYQNMYAARAGKGYLGSPQYAVFFQGLTSGNTLTFVDSTACFPIGFYVTNSTYAYYAMRDGYFGARKFGDTTGTHSGLPQGGYPDWYKFTIFGMRFGGVEDSVEFYLADFRFPNDSLDYIVKDWQWVDLSPLGQVDSLRFQLTSSDNHPQFGMNTPAYFCMDDLNIFRLSMGTPVVAKKQLAKVYPNPSVDRFFVQMEKNREASVRLFDISGRMLSSTQTKDGIVELSVSAFPDGVYFLKVDNQEGNQSTVVYKKSR